jgi:hypothetical protein
MLPWIRFFDYDRDGITVTQDSAYDFTRDLVEVFGFELEMCPTATPVWPPSTLNRSVCPRCSSAYNERRHHNIQGCIYTLAGTH